MVADEIWPKPLAVDPGAKSRRHGHHAKLVAADRRFRDEILRKVLIRRDFPDVGLGARLLVWRCASASHARTHAHTHTCCVRARAHTHTYARAMLGACTCMPREMSFIHACVRACVRACAFAAKEAPPEAHVHLRMAVPSCRRRHAALSCLRSSSPAGCKRPGKAAWRAGQLFGERMHGQNVPRQESRSEQGRRGSTRQWMY